MYMRMYMHMYVYMYVCICMYVCMYMRMYMRKYICHNLWDTKGDCAGIVTTVMHRRNTFCSKHLDRLLAVPF